jgi:chemosensory pili system protein ChpC
MQNAEDMGYLDSLLIPLVGYSLLLPNVAVAEVVGIKEVDCEAIQPGSSVPNWLLGHLLWRGVRIPLVSWPLANGEATDDSWSPTSRLAIINRTSPDAAWPFYAIMTRGLPRLLRVEPEMLLPVKDIPLTAALSPRWVQLQQERASRTVELCAVPNLAKLEQLLAALP